MTNGTASDKIKKFASERKTQRTLTNEQCIQPRKFEKELFGTKTLNKVKTERIG